MGRFIAVDLQGMEPPPVIEVLDFETIIAALKADMSARMAELELDFDVSDLESDPAVKILEVAAAREIVLRARVNGACKALLLALSQKGDLEHLGAWFGVERATVVEATTDPVTGLSVGEVMENDDRLRTRVQLAPQAFSTAGPYGAYEFNVLTAAPTVKSVGVVVPRPGHVDVYPLVMDGDGEPTKEVLDAIRLRLLSDDVRPLTDQVTVNVPKIQHIIVDVTLMVNRGPDAGMLMDAARSAIDEYAFSRHKVGAPFYLSGVIKAAKSVGVENVIVNDPVEDIYPGPRGCVFVEDIFLNARAVV